MHIDTDALLALAGLEPMPRRELTVNPCPEGYALTNVGGRLMCVLEGADQLTLEQVLKNQQGGSSSSTRGTRPGITAYSGSVSQATAQATNPGGP